MKKLKLKNKNILRKRARIRSRIIATAGRPRVSIHISNKHVTTQVVDEKGKTLAYASSVGSKIKGSKTDVAVSLASKLGEQIKAQKIDGVVFDRGSRQYRGRVKAFAESLRKSGVKF